MYLRVWEIQVPGTTMDGIKRMLSVDVFDTIPKKIWEKDRTTHGDIFELHWLSVFQTTSRPITLAVRSKRGRKKHVVGFKGVNAEYDSERKPGEKKKKKSCMNHELHD